MPPPDTIPRLTPADGLSPRALRAFHMLADIVSSLRRSAELERTGPNEWTVGGATGDTGQLTSQVFFPRFLVGPVAYTTAPNAFLAPQTIYHGNDALGATTVGLTILTAADTFFFDTTVHALRVGSPAVFSVDVSGLAVAASLSVAAGAFTVSIGGLLDVAAGPAEFRTGGNANVGVRVLQNSSSQSANLLEGTTADGSTVLFAFNAAGTNLLMPDQFSIGGSATATGTNATAVGPFSKASNTNSVGLGNSAQATGHSAIAIGPATASAQDAIAIGLSASATKASAIAIGGAASCAQSASCAIGGGVAAGSGELAWGNVSSTAVNAHVRLTGNSATQSRNQAGWRTEWTDSTDATHTLRTTLHVNDYNSLVNGREFVRADADGTYAYVGIGGAVGNDTRLTVNGHALGSRVLRLTTAATNDDPNLDWRQNRAATTDATVTTLETIAITASKTYLIEARVVARRTGGTAGTADDGAAYVRRAMVTTKAGTVTINAVDAEFTQEDVAGWDCTLDVSTTNVRVRVTGAADTNVTWHSHVLVTEVGT
jgi:hypothetical protein